MYRYLVADTCAATRLVALRDPAGRYHVAHCTSPLPDVQSVLGGFLPSVGSALMRGERGEVVRLTFRQVHCGQRRALELLHADGVPAEPADA
jgi:hypothetical protein